MNILNPTVIKALPVCSQNVSHVNLEIPGWENHPSNSKGSKFKKEGWKEGREELFLEYGHIFVPEPIYQ